MARDVALYRQAVAAAAAATGADPREVLSARRRKGVIASARQLALYLAVTSFNLSRRRVARITGRNRREVDRYCAQIEHHRERADYDQWVSAIEARLRP